MSTLFTRLTFSILGPHILKKFRDQCRNPKELQEQLLSNILEQNQDTAFGRDHRFSELFSFADFQREVPISEYETLEPYIREAMQGKPAQLTKKKPILFGLTSGTTGPNKYIPVTPESRDAKSSLMRVWLAGMYRDHPQCFAGKILAIVSPEEESQADDGTPCGAESGHGYKNMPWFIKDSYSSPYELFKIRDYQAKYYAMLRTAVAQPISLIYCCNPSTAVLLGERMEEFGAQIIEDIKHGTLKADLDIEPEIRRVLERQYRPDPERAQELAQLLQAEGVLKPRSVWPELAAIACWKGGTVSMYLEKFKQYYQENTPVRDIGYFATELRGSVPLSDEGDSGVLAIPTNVYEFWPADSEEEPEPTALLGVPDLEVGRKYLIYITTNSGLYRFNMHDIIEVTGFFEKTPCVRFVQKAKGFVSFTGEKLSEAQVLAAAETALKPLSEDTHFIAAVGELPESSLPHYSFLVEFESTPQEETVLEAVTRLEQSLREQNIEYAAKRDSLRLGTPKICCVSSGEFNRFREKEVRGGRSDGQFKILRLTDDSEFLKKFEWELEVALPEEALSDTQVQSG